MLLLALATKKRNTKQTYMKILNTVMPGEGKGE
jgi:hypothetical protein